MNRYVDDLHIGEKFEVGSVVVEEHELLSFARRFDPQPMHVDREAAAKGPFGDLIASGWHTAALVMKLNAEAHILGDTPVLGMGVEKIEWPVPVRAGDTIRAVTEVTGIRPSKSKPDFGIINFTTTAYNQRGEVVFVAHPNVWAPRRPVQ
ncbi:MAG: MaoC family dehydratase [Acidobacteriota bacterium]